MDYLQEAQLDQVSSGSKTNRILLFMIFGVIFVIIFVIVYLVFAGGHKNFSNKKMMEGTVFEIGEEDSIRFKLDEEDHDIMIDFVGLDSVDFTLSSEPIKINLKINEAKEVDVGGDGIADLRIKLVKIVEGKATIAIQKIETSACQERWECSGWSNCVEGVQIRECRDLNNCGTPFYKPPEFEECLEIEFVQDDSAFDNTTNNSLNNTSFTNLTNNTLINTTNTTNQIGANQTNSSINISIRQTGIINCSREDMSYPCLINASATCSPAFLNYTYEFDSSDVLSLTYSLSHFEIKGNTTDGRCIYYEKHIEEVNAIQGGAQSGANSLTLTEKICKINKEQLISIFTRWAEGTYSDYDFANAECYPHNNFDCKLNVYEEQVSGIHLPSTFANSVTSNVTISVKGFSNSSKIFWEVENSSVIRIHPLVGSSSTIYPLQFGSTVIIVRDTALNSCVLRIPFGIFGA